tara:strand:+ start:765 stop:1157 length:393 start_codon:yes stop_codon:yes gene_type:complete
MKVFKFFFIFLIVTNAVLIINNAYYEFQSIFKYNVFSGYSIIMFLFGILILSIFIYLAKRKMKVVFILVFLNAGYMYYLLETSFGVEVVLKSAIKNFNVNILLNSVNLIIALVAMLYWWYDSNYAKQKNL